MVRSGTKLWSPIGLKIGERVKGNPPAIAHEDDSVRRSHAAYRAERLRNILPQVQPKMDAPRHQSFPLNSITSYDRWREEATLGRAIRACRYDERHVVRKRSSHKVTADGLFVDSEGSVKLSAAAAGHRWTEPRQKMLIAKYAN